MKTQSLYKFALVMVVSAFLTACAGKKVQESVQVGEVGDDSGESMDETIVGSALDGDVMGLGVDGGPMGIDENDPLGKRTIYFEYNSSSLTFEGDQVAQAHGQFLADHPEIYLTLEGHADERGTGEYNLALAEDRAKIVSRFFAAYGVDGGRVQLVSYGEERPVALGHDEVAYSLNRRVEIIYQ
ncbi:MAG: peptidoglycan-associated lipoprotein [Saprospiraceae bacterium]|jgi:peptidoglycan-associated lipoprotein